MTDDNQHFLQTLMEDIQRDMQSDYKRVRSIAKEDSGTAGDSAEEDWAHVFRKWLPSYLKIVTKGRIVNIDGETSPQVDILILCDAYPEEMLRRKLYLASGVLAAFECKSTLRANHLREAVETCAKIKKLVPTQKGISVRKDVQNPIFFGLLAHDHDWKGGKSKVEQTISTYIKTQSGDHCKSPDELLDVVCVASLNTWSCSKRIFRTLNAGLAISDVAVSISTRMDWFLAIGHMFERPRLASIYPATDVQKHVMPIGALIVHLLTGLAWDDQRLRPLAEYFSKAKESHPRPDEHMREWPNDTLSEEVRRALSQREPSECRWWDEWS